MLCGSSTKRRLEDAEASNHPRNWRTEMTASQLKILVIGATGSIGRLVVEEALSQGHAVRALVRSPEKARRLPAKTEIVVGDLTRPETLAKAVEGIDGIVFTHGSDGGGKVGSETVDYGRSEEHTSELQSLRHLV